MKNHAGTNYNDQVGTWNDVYIEKKKNYTKRDEKPCCGDLKNLQSIQYRVGRELKEINSYKSSSSNKSVFNQKLSVNKKKCSTR